MWFRRAGVVLVWLAALAGGLVSLFALAPEHQLRGISLALAGSMVLTFVIQLSVPEKKGFVARLVASIVGAFVLLIVLSIVSVVLP